jgi:hypothetical protein
VNEILFADTDSESGSEASYFEDYFEEEEEAATSGGLPTWGPPQGRNKNIHPFVGPAKDVKKK